jgi:hypothetical protein
MQRTAPPDRPVFLAQDEADAAVLRSLGATVMVIGDGMNGGDFSGDNVVFVARRNGRELLEGMNLKSTGRFLELGANGSVEAHIQGHPDPLRLLDESAHDVYWHEERPISNWPAPEPVVAEPCGYPFLHPYLRWTCPELVILAGPYGCGKSSFTRMLAYKWADTVGRKKGLRASIVAWEDQFRTVKRELLRYSLEGDVATLNSKQAARLADMEGRVGWTKRHPDDARLISWYCELVEHRAKSKRGRVGFFIFDPFNEHDSTRGPGQIESDYVREMMIKLRRLAHGLGIILIVVTHVSAKSYDESGGIKPFRIANAAGSVQFGNKADRGICILRTGTLSEASDRGAPEHMVLHFDKCKDEEVQGRRGTVACVYNSRTMTLTEDAGATAEARKSWA